jgi:hypothetical protein|tara:strand:- start:87 stop:296 length:210 start_codon:yes stop_codon:yes gene_type:complete
VRAKAGHKPQRLRSKKLENAVSVNLLLYPPVGSMALHSKYKLTEQGADAKPKATAKKKSAKKEAPSEAS